MTKLISRIFVFLLICLMLSTAVFADMGPHFYVEVSVEMPEEQRPFYATLLSESPGTGPVGLWEGPSRTEEELAVMPASTRAAYAMAAYEDPDGYYLLTEIFYCKDGSFTWGYMPPDTFKVLLWFPDTGELVCSESLNRFAFASVFQGTLSDGVLKVVPVRNVFGHILNFLVRLILTLVIEVGLAFLFGYDFWPVLKINLITQIGLNIALALYVHSSGSGGFIFFTIYLMMELFIFLVEWGYYHGRLPETNPEHPGKFRVFLYALLANALSFGAGILLSMIWPLS